LFCIIIPTKGIIDAIISNTTDVSKLELSPIPIAPVIIKAVENSRLKIQIPAVAIIIMVRREKIILSFKTANNIPVNIPASRVIFVRDLAISSFSFFSH